MKIRKSSHSAKICGRTRWSFRTVRKFAEEPAGAFAQCDGIFFEKKILFLWEVETNILFLWRVLIA